MIVAFVALLAGQVEIELRERKPLPIVVLAPNGMATMSSSDLLREIGRELELVTSFAPEPVDSALVAECAGELSCMVDKLRALLERAKNPSWLLVVSSTKREGKRDRIAMTMVDADRANAEYAAVSKDDPDWRATLEAAVNERAVVARTRAVEAAAAGDISAQLRSAIREELRGVFEASATWEPYGTIEISGAGAGFAIELDGATVGTTGAGATRLVHALPGPRTIALAHKDYLPISGAVVVESGRTAQFSARPVPRDSLIPAVRSGVFLGGAALAASGAALVLISVLRQDGDVSVSCLGAGCESSVRFQSTGYSPEMTPRFSPSLDSGGVRIAPLGLALFGAGAIWSIGVLAFGEDRDVPWPEVVLGVVAGGAIYGLSVALEGGSAFDAPR